MAIDEDLDLDALEALERNATEGPWEAVTPSTPGSGDTIADTRSWLSDPDHLSAVTQVRNAHGGKAPDREANAAFIAAIRNHARALIAEARRARKLAELAHAMAAWIPLRRGNPDISLNREEIDWLRRYEEAVK